MACLAIDPQQPLSAALARHRHCPFLPSAPPPGAAAPSSHAVAGKAQVPIQVLADGLQQPERVHLPPRQPALHLQATKEGSQLAVGQGVQRLASRIGAVAVLPCRRGAGARPPAGLLSTVGCQHNGGVRISEQQPRAVAGTSVQRATGYQGEAGRQGSACLHRQVIKLLCHVIVPQQRVAVPRDQHRAAQERVGVGGMVGLGWLGCPPLWQLLHQLAVLLQRLLRAAGRGRRWGGWM